MTSKQAARTETYPDADAPGTPEMERLRDFVRLTRQKKEIEADLAVVKRDIEALQATIIDGMLGEGVQSFKLTVDGERATVYLHRQLWAKPRNGDRDRLVQRLEEIGLRELVTVNHMGLAAFVRESVENDGALPSDLIDYIETDERVSARVLAK